MTAHEFKILCTHIEPGTTMTFIHDGTEVRGTFIGCSEDAVIIQADDRKIRWPKDLCDYRLSPYQMPSH